MSAESFPARVGLRGEPIADPAAVVVHGESRFTVLTPRLIRIEWAPDGAFDDRPSYAFPTRRGPVSPFHIAISGDELTIDTGSLRLTRAGRSGPHTAANLSVTLEVAGAPVRWHPGLADPQNLRGARRTLDGCRGEAALDPGILSRSGWALHDDSALARFDPQTGWVQPPAAGAVQDWYLFGYGHDYKAALAEYARFGGTVPMIPRWLLGAWWSRFWPYSDHDIRRLIGEFAEHDFPLDVFVIDMDWHLPGWTGYSWNRELFPDPQAALAWIHRQGLRTTLNLHPADGVGPHEDAYPAFAAAMGVAPGEPIPFRSGDPSFVRHYFELLHHPLEEQGVDFWWMDWQQGRNSEIAGLDPLPWLNHLHYHDMRRRPGRRPFVFSRWGGLGNHRYPIGFSGDTFATWEALRFQPYFTATAANVLYGWWSHDVGGHFDASEPELYARWVQVGALSPILRLHSTNDPAAERRPWAFPPAVRDAAREAFKARYELLPYLYTLARAHADEALAPARPLYYEWPQAEAAYVAREQYALGDQLIVAPIVRPADPASGLAHADVWVPPGDWIERATGELLHGPRWARLVGDLNAIPQLVRAGGILPLAPERSRSHQQPRDQLTLAVYPGPSGAFTLYEDAGEGEEYRAGQYERTPIAARTTSDGRRLELDVAPIEGRCHDLPEARAYTVRLLWTRRPGIVKLDGEEYTGWSYDDQARTTVVEIPARSKDEPIALTVEADEALSLLGDAHNAALRAADARRLLGLASAGADPLEAALAGDTLAHHHALARLCGPFAAVYEYTTPEDAARTLGALCIAAPSDGTTVRASCVWRLVGPEGMTEEAVDFGELGADTIARAPFAWDRAVVTRGWAVDLTLSWRGRTQTQRFTSQTLFPTVGVWRTLAAPAEQPHDLQALIDERGAPRPELPWELHALSPAHGEFQNLTERFNVPLQAHAYAQPGVSLVGYGAAELHSPDEREARIAYQSPVPVRIFLNGAEIATEEHAEADPLRINPHWSRTAPVRLRQGANYLLFSSEHRGEDNPWRWFLYVRLLGADGLPAPDVAVPVPGDMLQ
jgi:alpha-glucosidase